MQNRVTITHPVTLCNDDQLSKCCITEDDGTMSAPTRRDEAPLSLSYNQMSAILTGRLCSAADEGDRLKPRDVAYWPIVLKKSQVQGRRKSS